MTESSSESSFPALSCCSELDRSAGLITVERVSEAAVEDLGLPDEGGGVLSPPGV